MILTALELVLDVLKLLAPSMIPYFANAQFFTIFRSIIFILLLNDIYKSKGTFGFALLVVFVFPILIQLIQVCLGNIFIHFCPQQTNNTVETGLLGLLKVFEDNSCPFSTRFQLFSYIESPVYDIKQFFLTARIPFLFNFLFSPYIFYFILFFKFCLFKLFLRNNMNPYLSLIPIVNKILLLKICKLPVHWIWILLIPFVRLFWMYKINRRLCDMQNKNKSNAIWATLIPHIFYGKFVFK